MRGRKPHRPILEKIPQQHLKHLLLRSAAIDLPLHGQIGTIQALTRFQHDKRLAG
jgi:hypothetical protein